MDWKGFFDRLGMDGTRWQWRIIRLEQRWEAWRARASAPFQHRDARQFKFCDRCGAMLERAATRCDRCGHRAPSWAGWRIRRALGLIVPSWCPVTVFLVLANLIVFVAAGPIFGWRMLFAPSSESLMAMGALVPNLVADGEWWRIITYGYLHIGLLHIGFNMLALSQVGPLLEEQVGRARFFMVYTLTLIAGALADVVLRGPVFTIIAGASGALFGLIGFGMSYAHFFGGYSGNEQRNFFARWAIYAFVFGFMVGADNIAHGGGFVAGAVLGWVIERERQMRQRFDPVWAGLSVLAGVLTAAAFAWMIIDAVGR